MGHGNLIWEMITADDGGNILIMLPKLMIYGSTSTALAKSDVP